MKALHLVIAAVEPLDVTTVPMDEAILRLAALKLVRAEYDLQKVPEPKSLGDQQLMLERRIRDLRYDRLAHELARLKGEEASDRTPDERRSARQQRIKELEAQLSA